MFKYLKIVKSFTKLILSSINVTYLRFTVKHFKSQGSRFYFVKAAIASDNKLVFLRARVKKCKFYFSGENNSIQLNGATLDNCLFKVSGEGNYITIEDNVKFRNATVVIRGNRCGITIGRSSTFGQIRLVAVGSKNVIEIGEDCLFADNVEIWASDTHTIFDSSGLQINPERSVSIGNRVWVGCHSKILKGVSIGDGAIIGMNTLVTKCISPNSLNAGSPNRVLKENVYWSLDYKVNEED